jgi:formylglycine-generating enzyme required for sulfatase activity
MMRSREEQLADLIEILSQAQNVRQYDDWLQVQEIASRLAAENEGGIEDLTLLADAAAALYRNEKSEKEYNRLNDLYEEGELELKNEEWENAIQLFQEVAGADPEFRDVQENLKLAINERQRASLYELALDQTTAGNLRQACLTWIKLLTEKWDYREGDAAKHFMAAVSTLIEEVVQPQKEDFKERNISYLSARFDTYEQQPAETDIPDELAEAMDWLEEIILEEITLSGEIPEDPELADFWLDKLATKVTERLDQEIVQKERSKTMMAKGQSAQEPTTGWLDSLVGKMTEELDDRSLQKRATPVAQTNESSLHSTHSTDWLNELVTKMTDRLEKLPDSKDGDLDEQKNAELIAKNTDLLERLAVKMTDKLEEPPKRTISVQDRRHPSKEDAITWTNLLTAKMTGRSNTQAELIKKQQTKKQKDNIALVGPDGKEMVCIPSGEFIYGVNRRSFFLEEFWIDKTPVTNAEYKRFLDANPEHPVPFLDEEEALPYNWDKERRTYPKGMEMHPVVLVNLSDVQTYAEWAGKRLASEQEWEKAARGVDGRTYPWGRIWQMSACNTSEFGANGTTPVGKFSPAGDSPYGCIDMSGNVWEWTASEYGDSTVVIRGGSWRNSHLDVWCTMRAGNAPITIANHIGFRLVSSSARLKSASLMNKEE